MSSIHLSSPPFSFTASYKELFKVFRGRMESDEATNLQDVGGRVTAPMQIPSNKDCKASDADRASPSKIVHARKPLDSYLTYCKGFLNLDQYPKLPEQDRAVIADFISGELLENVQWKHLFPSGWFECILNTTPGPETDEYTCTEYTLFKINFESVSCSKDVRRVWIPKAKSNADEPLSVTKFRSCSKESDSEDQEEDNIRNESLELQSPIKHPGKRRTPTRRRSFEERDRRRSSSRATSTHSVSSEPPSKKKKEKTTQKDSRSKEAPAASPAKRGRPGRKSTPGKPKKTSVSKQKQNVTADEQAWEVLTILDCKKKYGKYQYLVQWAGLDPEGKPWDDSWEPAVNVSEDLIRDYWQRTRDADKKMSPPKGGDGKVSVHSLLNSEPAA